MPKKARRQQIDKVREGGFTFLIFDNGETDVYRGKTCLGTIIGMKEASGRHSFRLALDQRRNPRSYRGRKKAAEALQIIDKLAKEAKQKKWSPQQLIIRAWDAKPQASPR